ncbi:peptidyl-tRNA hydrolase [Curtobacterium sp. MCSS17_016]|uniref:peptidyl-tRNA hydrolase n=1 Tax=Curtobacterium sp. MCSS17_016 TaxID=2175644 RepID=UPI000DA96AAC|nr:peptidyl-tRNA hydrolase [Curtobacterium sp. MCSS17_016]WIE81164.1 peptidyl-tRNA hydrolase [Curtobacterium sp. MCSS17_016]
MAGTTAGEHVQVIVLLVDRDFPADDRDGIAAAATASAASYRASVDDPVWDVWLGEAMAKSVRRADAKTFRKVQEQVPGSTLVMVGDAAAVAFPPMPNNALPKTLSRLQVSGTTLPRHDAAPVSAAGTVDVLLNADLDMSTGKAAAQAAHAFLLWSASALDDVTATPRIRFVPADEVAVAATEHGDAAVIEDAGRTEIAPGSLTAVAFRRTGGAR